MGYKTASAERTQAQSTVSSSVATFNNPDGTGFGVSSTSLNVNTIRQFSVVPGESSQSSTTVGGLLISNLYITDSEYVNLDDTAVGTSGGYVKLIGTNFQANAKIYFNNSTIANNVVNSTEIHAVIPAASIGNYPIYIFNPDGSGSIWEQGLDVSGFPTWTQTSYTSTSLTVNVQLLASGDGPLTYASQQGSSLPSGVSLSSSGVLTGDIAAEGTYTFTVVANDADNQSTQQEITLTVTLQDPEFEYTTLLLSGNGTNNSNNSVFLDSSTNNFAITRNGNATQGTFTPFSLAGWGNYFDGTGDYLSIAAANALWTAANSFTIEMWVKIDSLASNRVFFARDANSSGTGTRGLTIAALSTGALQVFYSVNGTSEATTASSTGIITTSGWYHVAFVKNGSACNLYLNGSSVISFTAATIASPAAQISYIGALTGSTAFMLGHISNFRVVNGTAVYTGAFTPPTSPLTAITNTTLLTCQSNRLIDNSTNNFTLTKAGDVIVSNFSPFSPTDVYSTSLVGGSAYFDGTGDYLTVADNDALDAFTDFTVEGWIYLTASTAGVQSVITKGASGIFQPYYFWISSARALNFSSSSTGASHDISNGTTLGTIALNTWYHIAASRSGSSLRLFLNGSLITTITNSSTLMNSTRTVGIGGRGDGTELFNGYISSVRLVKGTAVYTAAFTPPTAPVTNISNTSLLLNFTNAGIFDATSKAVLETAADAKISTAQSKFGGSSIVFDGSGDYLNVPGSPNYDFGTGNFTLEFWMYQVSSTGTQVILDAWNNAPTRFLVRTNGTSLQFFATPGNTSYTLPALNTWYHVAAVRNGSTFTLYVDGVSRGTFSSAATLTASTALWTISRGAETYNGYLSDIRVTKGYARYTANFTPPTSAFRIR
jgi:hypothetical protein